MLSYSVEVDHEGKPYFLHATQVVDEEGNSRGIVLEAATFDPDEIRIASIGVDPKYGYEVVKNGKGQLAGVKELEQLRGLVDFMTEEAPRQAVVKGRISPHWMERYGIEGWDDRFPFNEGVPKSSLPIDRKLYELIL